MRPYHLHVYFDAAQRDLAVALRSTLADAFGLPVGRVHQRAIGPHPKPMFQALVEHAQLADVLAWLMRHRQGLDVLLHPDTGDDLADHSAHAVWLGQPQPLRLDQLSPL